MKRKLLSDTVFNAVVLTCTGILVVALVALCIGCAYNAAEGFINLMKGIVG